MRHATEAELRQLIDISGTAVICALRSALDTRVFEFSDTLCVKRWYPHCDCCNLQRLFPGRHTKAFEQHRYSRLPVYRESIDDGDWDLAQ